jgi:L-lactate permease
MVTPVVTLAQVTGLLLDSVASVVGRQTPLPALVVPLGWSTWSAFGAISWGPREARS